jgi:hypothetical protein
MEVTMNIYLLAAAVLSAAVCLIHTFAGGRTIAVPLLKSADLHPVPKYVTYYCWHIVTIVLAMIAVMFALAALQESSLDLGWVATILVTAFCLLGLAVPPLKKQKYTHMPQGWLFLPIMVLGIAGGVV